MEYSGINYRKTVAFLIGDISHPGFQEPEWHGICDEAHKRGIRIVTINGDILVEQRETSPANIVYDRVDPDCIQGIIVSDEIGTRIGADRMRQYLETFRPRPVVSLHTQYQGIPAVVPANEREAMKLVIDHLAQVHRCRRIAYIRYPESHPSAKLRYEGYIAGMKANGLACDPELQSPLPTDWGLANNGITSLAEPFIRKNCRHFDALVACDDWGALWAADIMRSCGRRIPEDVRLAGFSDYPSSRNQIPSLSTLRIPYAEMGRQALIHLESLLDGKSVPPRTEVACELMSRESCGCTSPGIQQADPGHGGVAFSGMFITLSSLQKRLGSIVPAFFKELAVLFPATMTQDAVESFVHAWVAGLGRDSHHDFLQAVQGSCTASPDAANWLLSRLHRESLPFAGIRRRCMTRLSVMMSMGRLLCAEGMSRLRARAFDDEKALVDRLNQINQGLITSFNRESIRDILLGRLGSDLGINEVHLVLYDDPAQTRSSARLVISRNKDGLWDKSGAAALLAPGMLLPQEVWRRCRSGNLVVKPLFFGDEKLGYLVLDAASRNGGMYEILRRQLSSAIKGANLVGNLSRQSEDLAAGIQDVSVLEEKIFGNINLIVDRMLRQGSSVNAEAAAIEEMVHNIDTITTMSRSSRELSSSLKERLGKGMSSVQESLGAIREVALSSREIINFLELIRDVSEKTSLLALNAAIQAAHAGQAGRSFSVVADEIRKLADNTKGNIQNIEQVLSGITGKIDRSVQLSEKVGKELGAVIAETGQTARIADELNAAMVEQDKGAQELLRANQEIVSITGDVEAAMETQRQAMQNIMKTLNDIARR